MERVQRAEKRSAGTLGSGEPSPQSKLMLASERTRTGLPLTSGLVKYSPFQAAPAASAVGGAGVRVGAGAAGLVGSGVSVGGTGLGDGIWVGVADGAIVAVGAAVGNAVGEFARVAVAATGVNVAVGCGEGAGGGVSVAGAGGSVTRGTAVGVGSGDRAQPVKSKATAMATTI